MRSYVILDGAKIIKVRRIEQVEICSARSEIIQGRTH